MSDGVRDQVAELTELAEASGHRAPLRHVYASPPPGESWDADRWQAYWNLYERVMGLEGRPFSEAIHEKPGPGADRPDHRHRVYLALTERGTLIRNGHDYAKQEAVSRITEYDTASAFTKGAHNVRAARIATQLGRDDVAAAMTSAGLLTGTRARADLSPRDRAQEERTSIKKADVARDVLAAWRSSDSPAALASALEQSGLRLAMGDRKSVPVILDASGGVHALGRMLAMGSKAENTTAPSAADQAARLARFDLSPVDQVRAVALAGGVAEARSAEQAPPAPEPPLGGGEGTRIGGDLQTSIPPVMTSTPTTTSIPVVAPAAPGGPQDLPPAAAPEGARPPANPVDSVDGGGRGAGGAAPDDGGPPALTDTSPEGRRRWALALSDYDRRKNAKLADITAPSGEQPDDTASKEANAAVAAAITRWTSGPDSSYRTTPETVGDGRPPQLPRGHGPGSGDGATRDGHARDDTWAHGYVESRDADGFPTAPAGLAGAEAGGRTVEGRPRVGSPREDRSEPTAPGENASRDLAAAARARVEDARIRVAVDRGITDDRATRIRALTSALAHPPAPSTPAVSPYERARMMLTLDTKAGWDRVKRDAPWPDPRTRTVAAVRDDIAQRTHAALRQAEDAFKPLRSAAAQAEARVGFLDRLVPWTTPAQRDAEAASQAAQAAEDRVYSAQEEMASERRRVEVDGPRLAAQRSDEQAAWERSPEVREAKERERLNTAALQLARSGDPAVQSALAGGDPAQARAIVIQREAEQRQQAEEQQRQEMERQAQSDGPAAPVPGPRMR